MKTEQEINVAIAELCGWTFIESVATQPCGLRMHSYINNPKEEFCPDYCNDLDEMHEAESTLPTPHHCHVFDMELSRLLGVAAGKGIGNVTEWNWHATARQRAEAFLRTIGKWID